MKRNATVFAVMFTLFCSASLLAQSPASPKDPRIGTWKLNVAKSKLAEGAVAPQMQVRTYAERPDGFTVWTQVTLTAQGNATFNQITFKIDGKPYSNYNTANLAEFSVTGAKPGTNSYRLLGPNNVEVTTRDNTGKLTSTITNPLSTDGKTLTITTTDTTGKVTSVTVWEKQ